MVGILIVWNNWSKICLVNYGRIFIHNENITNFIISPSSRIGHSFAQRWYDVKIINIQLHFFGLKFDSLSIPIVIMGLIISKSEMGFELPRYLSNSCFPILVPYLRNDCIKGDPFIRKFKVVPITACTIIIIIRSLNNMLCQHLD